MSARSLKVAWSSRPLAAVYSGIAIRQFRPARSSLKGTAAQAESTAASAAPGRPVVLGKVPRYRQLGGGYLLLPPARSLSQNDPAAPADAAALPLLQQPGQPVVTEKCLGPDVGC